MKISAKLLVLLPWLFAFPIALVAPYNILLDNSILSSLVNLVEICVPMVKKIDEYSDTWQISKLFYAISWCCVPVSTSYWLIIFSRHREEILGMRKGGVGFRVFSIIFIGTIVVFLWYFGFSDKDLGRQVFITYSRFGMATLGSIFIILEAFLIAILIFNITHLTNTIKHE